VTRPLGEFFASDITVSERSQRGGEGSRGKKKKKKKKKKTYGQKKNN